MRRVYCWRVYWLAREGSNWLIKMRSGMIVVRARCFSFAEKWPILKSVLDIWSGNWRASRRNSSEVSSAWLDLSKCDHEDLPTRNDTSVFWVCIAGPICSNLIHISRSIMQLPLNPPTFLSAVARIIPAKGSPKKFVPDLTSSVKFRKNWLR